MAASVPGHDLELGLAERPGVLVRHGDGRDRGAGLRVLLDDSVRTGLGLELYAFGTFALCQTFSYSISLNRANPVPSLRVDVAAQKHGLASLVGQVSEGDFGVVVVGLEHAHLDHSVRALLRLSPIFGVDLSGSGELWN